MSNSIRVSGKGDGTPDSVTASLWESPGPAVCQRPPSVLGGSGGCLSSLLSSWRERSPSQTRCKAINEVAGAQAAQHGQERQGKASLECWLCMLGRRTRAWRLSRAACLAGESQFAEGDTGAGKWDVVYPVSQQVDLTPPLPNQRQ